MHNTLLLHIIDITILYIARTPYNISTYSVTLYLYDLTASIIQTSVNENMIKIKYHKFVSPLYYALNKTNSTPVVIQTKYIKIFIKP